MVWTYIYAYSGEWVNSFLTLNNPDMRYFVSYILVLESGKESYKGAGVQREMMLE